MLATLVDAPFNKTNWVYEEKYDGVRMLAYKEGSKVSLISRNAIDRTERYPKIAEAIAKLKADTLALDGEIVIFDEDKVSRFQFLQKSEGQPTFAVFDCIYRDGKDLRKATLSERRDVLEKSVKPSASLILSARLDADGSGWERGSVAMADHREASVTLPSDPVSVSAARRHVADVLAEWGLPRDDDAADTIRLIVSELATNAVQHTFGQSPTFTVDIELVRDEQLRIGVTDSHPRWPQRLPAAVQQDNGRGMVIIRSLTAECGGRLSVTPTEEGGKTVWIALPWKSPVPR